MKKSLISFVIFAGIILIARHIVSDIKQEERITALENNISHLYSLFQSVPESETIDTIISRSTPKPNTKVRTFKKTENYVTPDKTERTFDSIKFQNPILFEINTIDSVTLTRIPGIGARTASLIIKYRTQLGGFISPYQISERLTWDSAQENMNEWCTRWFKADSSLIIRLNINTATFRQIVHHPYISYEQTKALVNYRDKHKKIENINALDMLEEFSPEDINRIKPYIEFD